MSRDHDLSAPLRGRRAALRLGLGAAGAAVLLGRWAIAEEGPGRIVEVVAKRFEYTPNEIVARRDEKLMLAFRSLDFVHGFSLPDFGLRADLLPGRVTTVQLQPTRTGRFPFLCDNFCGDGHEEMNGVLIVLD